MNKNSDCEVEILETHRPFNNFYIVGIGTSAGGLEALQGFFSSCPDKTGMAFVIVQHLSPDYKSLMPELLSRYTNIDVAEAEQDMEVVPDHAYLIPGNKNIRVVNGKLRLDDRPPTSQINFSIDIFFNSLAKEQHHKAIGVILSGTGTDGTKGAKMIKEVGGTIMIQDPNNAKFDGMPRSAILNGLADFILPAQQMPEELVLFIKNQSQSHLITAKHLEQNEPTFKRILKLIKNHTNFDFTEYKRPTLLRRTVKRINITKCKSIEDYIELLYENPNEKHVLVQEFLIGVTKFFRDKDAFKVLENKIVPDIVERCISQGKDVKAWSVACSTGEEAYGIAMVLDRYIQESGVEIGYKIFATDVDQNAIEKASRGTFTESIELDVPSDYLNKYFIKVDDRYQISNEIRKNIIFSKHNVIQNPPFNKMDLISCRNLLIYLNNTVQAKVMARLHFALNRNGYLFLGSSETIGSLSNYFETVSSKWKIYRNEDPSRRIEYVNEDTFGVLSTPKKKKGANANSNITAEKLSHIINQILVNEVGAVAICINEAYDIKHAVGNVKKYINLPDQGYSNNILKLLSDDINLHITSGVRSLIKDKESGAFSRIIRFVKEDELVHLKLSIHKIEHHYQWSSNFLIIFKEEKNIELAKKDISQIIPELDNIKAAEIKELREALHETKQSLQATVEELETSNEEMQASNEELLASNEELQSTNEELQSLNEELHTVNAELNEKNQQLLELNADVENLIANVNIGTLFLDSDLNIRKYTPVVLKHINLREEDVGRSIDHFSMRVHVDNLTGKIKNVISNLSVYEEEVPDEDGNWLLLRISPYKTKLNQIKGAVINFIDITQIKKALQEKEQANEFLNYLTSASPVILYIYNMRTHKNEFSSRSMLSILGYSKEEIKELGDEILVALIFQEDMSKVIAHHEKIKSMRDGEVAMLEYRMKHKNGSTVWVLSADKIHKRDKNGNVISILGVASNISENKKMEVELQESQERFRLAVSGSSAGIWEWSNVNGNEAWWSQRFYELLGLDSEKTKSTFTNLKKLIHKEDLLSFEEALQDHLEQRKEFMIEIRFKSGKGQYQWFAVSGQAQWINDEPVKMVGMIVDIDQRKNVTEQLVDSEQRIRTLYNNAPTGIILSDLKWKIIEVSNGAFDILGYTDEDLKDKTFREITYNEDLEVSLSEFKKLREGLIDTMRVDKRYVKKDGNLIWCNLVVSAIRDDNDKILYYCAIVSDINDRKEYEKELKRINEELERFAYLASHDLKEPLRTIRSITSRFKEKYFSELPGNGQKYISFIEEAATRMDYLTNDLLVYSRLGNKKMAIDKVDLNNLMDEVKMNLDSSLTQNKATITSTELPEIVGNRTQLNILFQNLISNSIKYRKANVNPKITVTCKDLKDHWKFNFKDNGLGIDKEHHKKIFEIFRRLHNRDEYEGTGIGLANCARIVSNHKGKIWVTSAISKGCTVHFTISKNIKK